MESLGERLKELRESRDLTLDMVVTDMNQKYNIEITKGYISRWENNKVEPSLRLASYLCLYYGVSLDYLIGLTDVKTPVNLLALKNKRKEK